MPEVDLEQRARLARDDVEAALRPAPPALARLRQRRARRRGAGALGVAAAVLVVAAIAVSASSGGDGESVEVGPADEAPVAPPTTALPGTGTANADLLEPGEVRPIAPSPLSGRSDAASVWTGSEVVVWGGYVGQGGPAADGAAYDPRTDRWRELPPSPLVAREGAVAVWTGSEVIVWGGHGDTGGVSTVVSDEDGTTTSPGAQRDGAAYDPAANTWRSIAPAPFASAGSPEAVWTGSEMVVMAGVNSIDAGVYDPARDTWRSVPAPGRIVPPYPSSTWTGTEVVVGLMGGEGDANHGDVHAFDPATDEWRQLPDAGVDRTPLTLVATGSSVVGLGRGNRATVTLDPATEAWVHHGKASVGPGSGAAAVWTGDRVLVWSGTSAATFDPATGTWAETPSGDIVSPEQGGAVFGGVAVWADGVFVAWGGFPDLDVGVVLRPAD